MNSVQEPFDGIIPLNQIQGLGKRTAPATDATSDSAEKAPAEKAAVAKQKNNVTMTGMPADIVVVNPEVPALKESTEEPIVSPKNGKHAFIVGGFSPFTRAHHELVKHAQRNFEHVHVFTTQSKSRPIPVGDKVNYIKKAVGPNVRVSSTQTPLHAAAEVHKRGAKEATFVGGSDRKAIVDRVNQYNGKKDMPHGEYHFTKPVKLEVFGKERTEGGSGLAGISGTKARAAKNPEELKHFIPSALHPHAEKIFKQIHEDVELDEATSLQLRLHRGTVMRRNKSKLKNARAIARKRMGKNKNLRRRALKRARALVRQRVAGERGKDYSKLSPSDKMAIDRMADKRKKQIVRMANRLAPRVKSDDVRRLAAISAGKRVRNSVVPLSTSYEHPASNTLTEKAAIALKQKAAKANINFETIVEVFGRGLDSYPDNSSLTPQQYAFARVNSFLAKGKAFEEDMDLTRRNIMYTARDMVNTSHDALPKVLSFAQHAKSKKDDSDEQDPIVASRKKADLIRRATGEMRRKIIESSVYTRVANKIVRAKSPQIAVMKKDVIAALKKKDYESFANIIVYLMKNKMGNGARIQQEATEVSSQKRLATVAHKQGQHDQGTIRNNIADAAKRKDLTSLMAQKRALQARKDATAPIKMEDCCVPEEDYIYEEWTEEQWNTLVEENNEGKTLNKPVRTTGGPKKFAVYVKNDKGNIIKLGFGDPNLEIKRDDPDRRKAYRARHGCDNPGPKWKANWWSCNWSWSADKKVGA